MFRFLEARHSTFSFFSVLMLLVAGVLSGVRAQTAGGKNLNNALRSTQEQLAWIEENTSLAHGSYANVKDMLKSAKQNKDMIKIVCLEDKEKRIATNLVGVAERKDAFTVAVKSNQHQSAADNFAILKIYIKNIFGLEIEAQGCVGESEVKLGNTESTMDVDKSVTKSDPSEGSMTSSVDDDPPEHASAFY